MTGLNEDLRSRGRSCRGQTLLLDQFACWSCINLDGSGQETLASLGGGRFDKGLALSYASVPAISYSITNNVDPDGDGNDAFRIEDDKIVVNDADDLDYESDTQLVITAQASDGSLADTATVTIEVDDLDENDYGDAPAPYPVTQAEGGAEHLAVGPTLGSTRDLEADGTHSAAADADGADEDGIIFGAIQVGALDAQVTVNVQNAPSGAKLDGWIDFNADGNWGLAEERIFSGVDVVEGDNVLTFDVPAWAAAGATYAAFA